MLQWRSLDSLSQMGGYFWQKFPSAANAYGKLTGDARLLRMMWIKISMGWYIFRWEHLKKRNETHETTWSKTNHRQKGCLMSKQLQRSMEHLASPKWCKCIYIYICIYVYIIPTFFQVMHFFAIPMLSASYVSLFSKCHRFVNLIGTLVQNH